MPTPTHRLLRPRRLTATADLCALTGIWGHIRRKATDMAIRRTPGTTGPHTTAPARILGSASAPEGWRGRARVALSPVVCSFTIEAARTPQRPRRVPGPVVGDPAVFLTEAFRWRIAAST